MNSFRVSKQSRDMCVLSDVSQHSLATYKNEKEGPHVSISDCTASQGPLVSVIGKIIAFDQDIVSSNHTG